MTLVDSLLESPRSTFYPP